MAGGKDRYEIAEAFAKFTTLMAENEEDTKTPGNLCALGKVQERTSHPVA
jgi:hypothetical protein